MKFFVQAGLLALCLCVLTGCKTTAASNEITPSGPIQDPLLKQALYTNINHFVTGIRKDGAIGASGRWEEGKTDKWYIETQRYGGDLVQAGIGLNDRSLIDKGLKVLDWGFSKQASDGSFPGTGDPYHSTSLFIEASARAMILLKQYDAQGYSAELAQDIPKVHLGAQWLNSPDVKAAGQRHNAPYTHRAWVLAAALGESANITDDHELALGAREFARIGISLQQSDGVDPEKGSYDVSYQGYGLLQAGRYYAVCGDADLKSQIAGVIQRGLDWELGRVGGGGQIQAEGSSRTGRELDRTGNTKKVDIKSIAQAFVYGSMITGKTQYHDAAQQIAQSPDWLAS